MGRNILLELSAVVWTHLRYEVREDLCPVLAHKVHFMQRNAEVLAHTLRLCKICFDSAIVIALLLRLVPVAHEHAKHIMPAQKAHLSVILGHL